jgi:hypothetical protein
VPGREKPVKRNDRWLIGKTLGTGCSNQKIGATVTPRKPNYDFERRERERSKAAESAKKAQAKADKRELGQGEPNAEP